MILYAFLSILAFGLLDNFRGPFFSQILRSLDRDDGWGGLYFAMTSGLACLSSAVSARWMAKVGIHVGLHTSAAAMALGFGLMAIAPHYWVLIFAAAVFGVGAGLGNYAQNATVTELTYEKNRPSVLSGLHAMYGLASMLSPWLAAQLMQHQFDWRNSFLLCALVPLLLLGAGLVLFRKQPKAKTSEEKTVQVTRRQRRHVYLLAIGIALYLLAEISIGTRLVRWLEIDRGIAAVSGSIYLAGFFGALLLGRLLTWWKAPHTKKALAAALLALAITASLSLILTLTLFPQLVVLSGLALGPFYPLAVAYLRLRFHRLAPLALSVTLSIGSLTVLLMHLLMGWLAQNFGQTQSLFLGPIGLLIGAMLIAFETRCVDEDDVKSAA